MAATRLTDSEYAERGREANRVRSQRHRERRYGAGRVALTVWVAEDTKRRLLALATAEAVPIAEVADRLLSAALSEAGRAAVDPPPVESPVDRDTAIRDLHSQRLTPTEISRRLATMGIVASTGNPICRATITRVLEISGLKPNR